MSLHSWRYTVWYFLCDIYYFVRTGEQWWEVRNGARQVWRETTAPARLLGQFFARIWKYRNILWDDFDWDHSYLLYIMEFKFLNMMKYHRDHGHTMDNAKIAHELRECAEICQRMREGDYCAAENAAHEAKWGEAKFESVPAEEFGRDKLGKPKMYSLNVSRPNTSTEELKQQEIEERRVIWELEEQRHQADLDRLAELIRTRIGCWWD